MNAKRAAMAGAPGQVRIIGGAWRGSKLPVPALPGLRPTADRVRETLFNWLQPALPGARVLDLFAGSGALGFEAASRGAARVDLVEAAPAALAGLRESAARLGRDGSGGALVVHGAEALAFLAAEPGPWDIAFVDPPFAAGLWPAALAALSPRLVPGAFVYVEAPVAVAPGVPAAWRLHRELATREARAALYRVPTA
ncbi:16S rRNA (guanine(966)-N(2))-methyltransferase RsmD [Silanimonas lenta]|uniref:16S rRNA (guanine(966)-N(2))-methyltransferase RsmD n=1 Tax=Silanimonas lenta TaxID=265429 RepID=UPI002FE3D093